MTKQHNNKDESNVGANIAMGVGIAALAAAAAGAAFLYGTDAGKKKQKQIKSWMLKAKGDVLEHIENMKDVTEESYNSIVDSVTQKYQGLKEISPEELGALVQELKGHWKTIKSHMEGKKTTSKKKKA